MSDSRTTMVKSQVNPASSLILLKISLLFSCQPCSPWSQLLDDCVINHYDKTLSASNMLRKSCTFFPDTTQWLFPLYTISKRMCKFLDRELICHKEAELTHLSFQKLLKAHSTWFYKMLILVLKL